MLSPDGQFDWLIAGLAVVAFAIALHALMSTNDEKIRRLQRRAEHEFLPQIRGE